MQIVTPLITLVIFLVVLVVLILVHELGHFIVAKLCRMRVDEFGIGFPPRALTIARKNGTEYTLNWLPIGGFVRIYGEDGGDGSSDSFTAKPKILQMLTLIAGIVMNLIFGYILLTLTLGLGTQQVLSPSEITTTKDVQTVVAGVDANSMAQKAGFMEGDIIKGATTTVAYYYLNYNGSNPGAYSALIAQDASATPMTFLVNRNGKDVTIVATPKLGMIPGSPKRPALGFTLTAIGTVKTPWIDAPGQGLSYTWNVIKQIAIALWDFLKGVVELHPDLSQVAGPVGIENAVGQASANGISALLTLVALISINLALVNLIPIPALDGGRLLFVIIETITRKQIPAKVAERVNAVGFALLILLVLVVTVHDIFK